MQASAAWWAFLVFPLAAWPGCRDSAPEVIRHGPLWNVPPARQLGIEVARVGSHSIYAAQVVAQARHMGVPPAKALARLVELHLLAERSAEPTDPASVLADPAAKRLLVERLAEEEFEPSVARDKLPEADLRKMYDHFQQTFVHPRLVEVALLSVYTGPNMKAEPRARAKATAEELFKHLLNRPPTDNTAAGFEAISKEPVWSDRKVKYWRFFQGPDRPFGPFGKGVGAPIQKLRKVGDTTGLIEDDSGYHVALYLGESPAKQVPFEVARSEIAQGYFPRWRQQRFNEWTKNLAAAHKVEVFAERAGATSSSAGFAKP